MDLKITRETRVGLLNSDPERIFWSLKHGRRSRHSFVMKIQLFGRQETMSYLEKNKQSETIAKRLLNL